VQSVDVVAQRVPQRIRVSAEAQAAKLVTRVEPGPVLWTL
jgi:hypothetical protein